MKISEIEEPCLWKNKLIFYMCLLRVINYIGVGLIMIKK